MVMKYWGYPEKGRPARWEFAANKTGEEGLETMFFDLTRPWYRARVTFTYSFEPSQLPNSRQAPMVHVVTIRRKRN